MTSDRCNWLCTLRMLCFWNTDNEILVTEMTFKSHSRSLAMVQLNKLYITYKWSAVTVCLYGIVSEILNVKWWRTLEIWIRGYPRSLKMAPLDRWYKTSYQSAIVSIHVALSCTIFQIFYREEYCDLKSRLRVTRIANLCTVCTSLKSTTPWLPFCRRVCPWVCLHPLLRNELRKFELCCFDITYGDDKFRLFNMYSKPSAKCERVDRMKLLVSYFFHSTICVMVQMWQLKTWIDWIDLRAPNDQMQDEFLDFAVNM